MKLPMDGIEVVAYDFDGTLADTVGAHTEARARAFADYGLTSITPEQALLAHRHGNRPHTIIAGLLKETGFISQDADPDSHEVVLAVTAAKTAYYRELCRHGLDALPGALENVQRNYALLGGKVLLVTSAALEEVMPFTARYNLGEIFSPDRILTMETVIKRGLNPKPAPDIYELAAEVAQVAPESMLIIEDSTGGVEAGKQAGCPVMAVGTTNPRDIFYATGVLYQPDYFAESFNDVTLVRSEG